MIIKHYIKLIRVKHYIKNILIFLPALFADQLFNKENLFKLIIAFIVFSCTASCVYVFNDIQDIEKDRKHEVKKNRPLASGAISIKNAQITIICLVCIITISSLYLWFSSSLWAIILPAFYLITNVYYSKGLKNVPLIDVAILTLGFFLRVVYGAAICKVSLSEWLYLTVITFSLCLGLSKRRNELIKSEGNQTRKVLQYYNYNFLDKNFYMCMGLGMVFYSLWTIDPSTIERFGNNYFSWTIPLVLFILLKYNLDIEGNSHGDPVEVLLSDKKLLLLCAIYIIVVIVLIYGVI